MICWKCKKEIPLEKPARSDECPLCHADLHVCKACEFYESGAHNDCRETSADMVTEKERANFCDYFRYKAPVMFGLDPDISSGNDKAAAARDAFNALFN
jgi:hypothetical protein